MSDKGHGIAHLFRIASVTAVTCVASIIVNAEPTNAGAVPPVTHVDTNRPATNKVDKGETEITVATINGIFSLTSAIVGALLTAAGAYGVWVLQQKKLVAAQKDEGKRANQELMEKAEMARIPNEQEWAQFFSHELSQTADVAAEIALGSRLIVVASGKGGVGKSTLSLNLMEYFTKEGPALLVDFDMPNRGLSSLMRKNLKDYQGTYTLDEMERFSSLFKKSGLSAMADSSQKSEGEALKAFKELRTSFEMNGETADITRDLKLFRFGSASIRELDKTDTASANPRNAYFLPSVKPGDLFLSSGVFSASFLEVFYFLKCLAHWANQTHNIRNVIVDCHGAHDLFMVGAIHASTELIVVTTPDPGSFDGTFDLLAFADKLKSRLSNLSFPSALVINNCRHWQQESRDVIEKFFAEKSPVKLNAIVGIQASEQIRDISVSYELGKASRTDLWKATKTLGDLILSWRDEVQRQKPEAVKFVSSGSSEVIPTEHRKSRSRGQP